MSKKKVAVIFAVIAFLVAAVLAGLYFIVIRNGGKITDYEMLRLGMKPWENTSVPGISLYVPEDYEKTQNEFYTSYVKDGATVSLTSEKVDNDLVNYAYNAVRKYENITDSFNIREEKDEMLAGAQVHVVRFDYGLSLDSGIRTFSALSAYVMGEGRSYVLTCVADAEEFPKYEEDFRRIYKTMALTEEKKK
ncbi:hypothetical protein [Ruminococcus sp. HUN007]|uniref:hypothetical protein n=1 Tax=Ruminococcus sp. HUN007 TaxID=1514668 RepID=UPI0005D199E1|nr:hypothetical protein [Ruminococcus sp. HUN007]